jgi:hypothetical protein
MSDPIAAFVTEVRSALGDPYVYGATGPKSFDCSGLVQWAASKAGFHGVPRTSEAQWNWVTKINKSQLQPGDLIFTQWPGDDAPPGHVQVYIGNGKVIGADTTRTGVETTNLAASAGHIVGYGRIPGVAAGSSSSGGGIGGGLLSLALPDGVLTMFSDAEKLVQGVGWFINPENWARLVAGGVGAVLAAIGLVFLVKAGA